LICTDGLANVGIGNLDLKGETQLAAATVYSDIAEVAKQHGITVSVVSIRGDDCSMESLGTLADATNGEVDIVDPIELGTKSVNALNIPIVATNVEINVYVRKELQFFNGKSTITETYGNDTSESDISFSYRPLTPIQQTKCLLFQVQVRYTRLDGSRCLRILTKSQHITSDRDTTEKALVSSIIGMHALHESASLAQLGEYQHARVNLISNQRLLQRGMITRSDQKEYINFIKQAERLDGFMREAQQMDSILKTEDALLRKQTRDDAAARNIVKMKKVTRSAFVSDV